MEHEPDMSGELNVYPLEGTPPPTPTQVVVHRVDNGQATVQVVREDVQVVWIVPPSHRGILSVIEKYDGDTSAAGRAVIAALMDAVQSGDVLP